MLTEEDFDDIGKRLYDLEADPPEKGWNRIAADIIPPPPGRGKQTFLGRHWWKGLLILIPVSVYLVWPEHGPDRPEANLSALVAESNESGGTVKATTEAVGAESPVSEADDMRKSTIDKPNSGNEPIKETAGMKNPSKGIVSKTPDDRAAENSLVFKTKDAGVAGSIHKDLSPGEIEAGGQSNSLTPYRPGAIQADGEDRTQEENTSTEKGSPGNGVHSNRIVAADLQPAAVVNTTEAMDNEVTTRSGEALRQLSEQERLSKNGTGRDTQYPSLHDAEKNVQPGVQGAAENEKEATTSNHLRQDQVDSTSGFRNVNGGSGQSVVAAADSLTDDPENATEVAKALPEEQEEQQQDEEAQRISTWRITAALAPQFSYKSVTPVGNDEVLVTNINTRSSYPARAGFGFAIGAGKEVLRNLYLDAQLTYTRTSQTVDFSSSTGKVDTLLAIQGQDGNVRVIPVYEVTAREQKSTLGYGGLRMTATHYFWSKGKRRFNISAGAGMNLILSDSFEEKINGTWIRNENVPLNKTNYNFTLGAGYNVAFGNGWEIMLSPMLTHYLKKIESNQQPFRLSHRSYGLNIMLSKSLR